MSVHRSDVCDRARWYASLDADGELSQFERALLDAHLTRCRDCTAFRSDVVAIAGAVRGARLEPLAARVAVRRYRRPAALVRLRVATAAAAALVGIGTVLAVASSDYGSRTATPSAPREFMTTSQLQWELALLRRADSARAVSPGGGSIAI